MILYVAGPMTGLPEYNFPAFHAATQNLRNYGYSVLNPARRPAVDDEPWADCLRLALRDVLEAEGVALLDGWEKSRGAVLEVNVAASLGMPCKRIRDWLDLVERTSERPPCFT